MKGKVVLFALAALFFISCGNNCCTEKKQYDQQYFDQLDSTLKSYTREKDVNITYIDARNLNLIGKALPTPEFSHRIDTCEYKGFTKGEKNQAISGAGLALVFKTNSPVINLDPEFGWELEALNTMPMAYRGFDLYIQKDGKWLWAASKANWSKEHRNHKEGGFNLIDCMDNEEKICLLYLPMYSELKGLKVGVAEGSYIEAIDTPFRHKIVFHGSSFTQGISISRAGMSYPTQFSRKTGLGIIPLGFSGNCKMQPYFADFLEDVQADAFVFDSFSNPGAKMIYERVETFVDRMVASHPGVPLIFQRTIYRESRNFNCRKMVEEQARQDMSDSMMKELCKKYKDVYYIVADATSEDHETSVDGTHPGDYGYTLWARSIEKPILKILAKYGIK